MDSGAYGRSLADGSSSVVSSWLLCACLFLIALIFISESLLHFWPLFRRQIEWLTKGETSRSVLSQLSPRGLVRSLRRPEVGDVVAGLVSGVMQLTYNMTFAKIISTRCPGLEAFFVTFLRYQLWGYIVAQLSMNVLSRHTPLLCTNFITFALAVDPVVVAAQQEGADAGVIAGTVLIYITLAYAFAGLMIWFLGFVNIVEVAQYLSNPVRLGIQALLGYYMLSAGISTATGISWQNFRSIKEASVYLSSTALIMKWVASLACALITFLAAKRWAWPYTIPVCLFLTISGFYVALLCAGVGIEEARAAGWVLQISGASSSGFGGPFAPVARMASFREIAWSAISQSLPAMLAVAGAIPVLTTLTLQLLIETCFTADEIGASSLSFELRASGIVQAFTALLGGASCCPAQGDTMLFLQMGGRTGFGACAAVLLHAAALFIPGCIELAEYLPRLTLAVMCLLLWAYQWEHAFIVGFASHSRSEFMVICIMLVVGAWQNLYTGIFVGFILDMLLRSIPSEQLEPDNSFPVRGSIASSTTWGMRSAELISQLSRRVISLQCGGYRYHVVAQRDFDVALEELQREP